MDSNRDSPSDCWKDGPPIGFAIKRSKNPGFAGIDNALYFDEKTWMLFGDAKQVVGELVKELSEDAGIH